MADHRPTARTLACQSSDCTWSVKLAVSKHAQPIYLSLTIVLPLHRSIPVSPSSFPAHIHTFLGRWYERRCMRLKAFFIASSHCHGLALTNVIYFGSVAALEHWGIISSDIIHTLCSTRAGYLHIIKTVLVIVSCFVADMFVSTGSPVSSSLGSSSFS